MSNKELSIIIVNYRSERFLPNCLKSVFENVPGETEVIVVNNDEVDIAHLEKDFPGVRIINNKKNIGFGAAANAGAEKARAEKLLFLNPDSLVETKNVLEVLDFFQKNPETAILGSRVICEKGSAQEWIAGKEATFFDLIFNNFGFIRSRSVWSSKKTLPVDWVSGTALFVRKDHFDKAGGFDEDFFMYFEDMDLCLRLRRSGHQVFYYPNFIVKHAGGASYENKKEQKRDYYASQDYYFKKHRPAWEGMAVKWLRRMFS